MNTRGRPKAETEALERYFKGMRVKEAVGDLLIVPQKEDIDKAVRGDPEKCALAMACIRQYGSKAALVWRSVAYIDLPEKGGRVVTRFVTPKETWDAIKVFDKGGLFPEAGFLLRAPSKSRTLEYMREANKSRTKAIIQGRSVKKGRHKTPRGNGYSIEGVRTGTGQVHFPDYEKESPKP